MMIEPDTTYDMVLKYARKNRTFTRFDLIKDLKVSYHVASHIPELLVRDGYLRISIGKYRNHDVNLYMYKID